ncbi:MAG: putative efflux pump rane fusion protein [Acidobacteria bacterium]|nr:putative efflux pump rane fusion protein [Acidobacteriota bacterium]
MMAQFSIPSPPGLEMTETYAKLRSDLEIRPESQDRDTSIIIKDPISRRFYRFTSVQGTVLQLLDGSRTPRLIADLASEKHGTAVLESQVEDFIVKLRNLLLLDHPVCWNRLAQHQPRNRLLQSILSIKIHAFNPDKLLDLLSTRLRFCFGPGFAAVAIAITVIALIISVLNWKLLFVSLGTLFTLYSLPLIVIIAFAVMTIHEFAHGATLKHYGGKVEEMGFLVLYFIPAFYSDVSDAWLLKKRERIRVTLAGGYIQLIIWAAATILWRLVAQETLLSRICLITVAFSGIMTLLNLIPFIRLDGYYLLSDYLEIPNLQKKSYAYLKHKVLGWLNEGADSAKTGLSARERRTFTLYGISSLLFSAGLLLLVLWRLGGWMVREFQGWGVLAISAFLLIALPVANKENVKGAGKYLVVVTARLGKSLASIIILLVLLAVCFLPWELKVAGDFTLLPYSNVLVNAQTEGTLKAIYVDEGSRVRKDEVLADIENLEINKNYEDTKGELASQRATLTLLLSGSRPEEIERARRQIETKRVELTSTSQIEQERKVLAETVAKKEAELENARVTYERTKKLLESGLIARNEADRDRTNFEVLTKELSEAKGQLQVLEERTDRTRQVKRKELEQAQSELKLLLAGSRKEQIQITEASVKKLEEKLNLLTKELEHLKILSPIDGVIATPHLKNKIGKYLDKGDLFFCEIVSEGVVIVEMPVPEKEIADVRVGYPITIKVRGYPQRSFEARVKSIAPVALETNGERKVTVKGELANPDGVLKSGMTGVGKILCGKRMIAELLSRRAIRWLRTEFWEYLP